MHQPRAGGRGTGPRDPQHHPQVAAVRQGCAHTSVCHGDAPLHGPAPHGINVSPLPLAFGGRRGPPSPAGPPRHRPAAVVVAAHEHLAAAAADGAVGLVTVIVVLVRALQEAVLGGRGGKTRVSAWCAPPPEPRAGPHRGYGDRAFWGGGPPPPRTLQFWHIPPMNRGCSRVTLRLPQEMQISGGHGGGGQVTMGGLHPPQDPQSQMGPPCSSPLPMLMPDPGGIPQGPLPTSMGWGLLVAPLSSPG